FVDAMNFRFKRSLELWQPPDQKKTSSLRHIFRPNQLGQALAFQTDRCRNGSSVVQRTRLCSRWNLAPQETTAMQPMTSKAYPGSQFELLLLAAGLSGSD